MRVFTSPYYKHLSRLSATNVPEIQNQLANAQRGRIIELPTGDYDVSNLKIGNRLALVPADGATVNFRGSIDANVWQAQDQYFVHDTTLSPLDFNDFGILQAGRYLDDLYQVTPVYARHKRQTWRTALADGEFWQNGSTHVFYIEFTDVDRTQWRIPFTGDLNHVSVDLYNNGVVTNQVFPAVSKFQDNADLVIDFQTAPKTSANQFSYMKVMLTETRPERTAGHIYITEDPTGKTFRLSKQRHAFEMAQINELNEAGVIEGINFEEYSSMFQSGIIEGARSVGLTIQGCSFRSIHGAAIFAGNGMTIDSNTFTDVGHSPVVSETSLSGYPMLSEAPEDIRITNNTSNDCYRVESWFKDWAGAGLVKAIRYNGIVISGNTINRSGHHAIWVDVGGYGARINNNTIRNSVGRDIFVEICEDTIVEDNLCEWGNQRFDRYPDKYFSFDQWAWSASILSASSPQVTIRRNTVRSNYACICLLDNDNRGWQWTDDIGNDRSVGQPFPAGINNGGLPRTTLSVVEDNTMQMFHIGRYTGFIDAGTATPFNGQFQTQRALDNLDGSSENRGGGTVVTNGLTEAVIASHPAFIDDRQLVNPPANFSGPHMREGHPEVDNKLWSGNNIGLHQLHAATLIFKFSKVGNNAVDDLSKDNVETGEFWGAGNTKTLFDFPDVVDVSVNGGATSDIVISLTSAPNTAGLGWSVSHTRAGTVLNTTINNQFVNLTTIVLALSQAVQSGDVLTIEHDPGVSNANSFVADGTLSPHIFKQVTNNV